VRGVIVGDLAGCAERDGSPPDAESVIAERFADLGIPVVAGAPIGHGTRNRAVPHGAPVRIDGDSVQFLDGVVA
jgi:muramoyltetrapeptide carboxypeptidase